MGDKIRGINQKEQKRIKESKVQAIGVIKTGSGELKVVTCSECGKPRILNQECDSCVRKELEEKRNTSRAVFNELSVLIKKGLEL